MKELSKEIYEKYQISDLPSFIGDRFIKAKAELATDYPYILYKMIAGSPDYTFSENFEMPEIQFEIFSDKNSTSEIEDLYTTLINIYDELTMNPTGEEVINMTRTAYSLIAEEHSTMTGDTKLVWHYTINYELLVQTGV